jgi:MarR family transcriptional regulator, organic hydroperoxide resistance regulator
MKNYYSDNLYYTSTALTREIAGIAENSFLDLGLTPSDAYLIMVVNEKPNVQPTEISERILLAPSTITRMIEKLEKRSILTRRQEGKYTYVAATAKGKDIYPNILSKWEEINSRFQACLGDSVINNLLEATGEAARRLRS